MFSAHQQAQKSCLAADPTAWLGSTMFQRIKLRFVGPGQSSSSGQWLECPGSSGIPNHGNAEQYQLKKKKKKNMNPIWSHPSDT